jgi:hypothetical protein
MRRFVTRQHLVLSSLVLCTAWAQPLVIAQSPSDRPRLDWSESATTPPVVSEEVVIPSSIPHPGVDTVYGPSVVFHPEQIVAPMPSDGATLEAVQSNNDAPLRIWNLPYGLWLQIKDSKGEQKVLYHHRDSTGMRPIDVHLGPEADDSDEGFHDYQIRVARSPREFQRGGCLFEDEVTLATGHSVDFDYVREKWARDSYCENDSHLVRLGKPKLPLPAAFAGVQVSTQANPAIADSEPAKIEFFALTESEGHKGRFDVTKSGSDGLAFTPQLPPDGVRLLGLKTSDGAHYKGVNVLGAVKVTVRHSGEVCEKTFRDCTIALTTEEVANEKGVYWLVLSKVNLEKAIDDELRKYLLAKLPKLNEASEASITITDCVMKPKTSTEPKFPLVIPLRLIGVNQ